MPQYSVNNFTIDNVLNFIKNNEIAIPEIQRPFDFIPAFCAENPDMEPKKLNKLIEKVRDIRNAPIGVINLDKELSIDKVTEIFIRINSQGASLTQADFVMSTIAADVK